MIQRTLLKTIKDNLKPGFITIIYGPRRVGKTTLLKQLAQTLPEPKLWFNGDHQETRDVLSQTSLIKLSQLVKNHQFIFIDEAQRIPSISLTLKILIDTFPQKKIFVTGSSSLLLSQGLQEPLTGRNLTYKLYPLSTQELTSDLPNFQKTSFLENQLIYGGYPYLRQLVQNQEKKAYLQSITQDYLSRDIILLKDVSSTENLKKLAILLAWHIGSEVSLNELAKNLNIDVKTVKRYLFLLKQGFIIFELGAFARNLRKEVSKSKKYYFWDLGIRNALIEQFLPLEIRKDVGSLWENFLIIERLKKHQYQNTSYQYYFWRTYDQAEIDWIEAKEGKIQAYEFKWQRTKARTPKAFKDTYHTQVELINKNNYLEFV